jgi:hypothetical protein
MFGRNCGAFIGFDVDFNLSTLFQLHFVAILVSQFVCDANFLIQGLRSVN